MAYPFPCPQPEMDMKTDGETIHVAGAGPAGLAAAITLARAGRRVVVHEARPTVGARFRRDFQGIENWSGREDALESLRALGIDTRFDYLPGTRGWAYDAWGVRYPIRTRRPLFYLIERGPGPGTLDSALLAQARALGIEVRFNARMAPAAPVGIDATGPRLAQAVAVGYHFETELPDGFHVVCDDGLAPKGYAYLLVWNGRGTLKTCLFEDFGRANLYVARTVEAFERLVGLRMRNPRRHGGIGQFGLPPVNRAGGRLLAGERAGFQDFLWGFGIRYAILSGVLAARSLLDGIDYVKESHAAFMGPMRAALVNRQLYAVLGNRGYRWALRRVASSRNLCESLRRRYRPSALTWLMWPWARWRAGCDLGPAAGESGASRRGTG